MTVIASPELKALAPVACLTPPAIESGLREYLSFRVGTEEYAIDILQVQEIRSYEAPMRLAGAPDNVCGVTNLRGVIVPILDLRLQLGETVASVDRSTVIIVLNVHGCVVGAVVDSVSDVVELSAEGIKPVPELRNGIGSANIVGIAPIDSPQGARMLILLDIETMLGIPQAGHVLEA